MNRSIHLAALIAMASLAAPSALDGQESRRYVDPRMAGDSTVPPFSGGVLVGNTFYLAGKIGLTPDRRVPATPAEEARLVLDDVKATLEKVGMTMDDLVSVQVFCSDVSHYDAFNRVYRTYFKKEFPARAFLGSGPLLFGARFEVQGIAVRR
ncbi:MAG TPA: Rid family hydrolase [Gemmatimonadaceae bacterium]|nr:Rid family hydrolase [Gemmatimonadaceae bacterium]